MPESTSAFERRESGRSDYVRAGVKHFKDGGAFWRGLSGRLMWWQEQHGC